MFSLLLTCVLVLPCHTKDICTVKTFGTETLPSDGFCGPDGAGWKGDLSYYQGSTWLALGMSLYWRKLVHRPECADRIKVFEGDVRVGEFKKEKMQKPTINIRFARCEARSFNITIQIFNVLHQGLQDTCYESSVQMELPTLHVYMFFDKKY